MRGFQDVLAIEAIRIGIAGLLSRDDADADTQTYAFRRTLDDLLLENNGVVDPVLKVEIRIVAPARERLSEVRFKIAGCDVVFFEEDGFAICRFH